MREEIIRGTAAIDLNGRDSWDTFACQSATENENQPEKADYPEMPTDRKYTIGIDEAARYYGIGTKKLRQIIADHPYDTFYLEIGRRVLLKRRQFEEWLDSATSI